MTIECAEGGFICFDDYEELAQRFSLDEKGTIYFTSWKHREIVRRFRKKISAEFAREILDIAAEVFPKEFEKCPDPYVICDAMPDEILLKKSDGTYHKGWVHGGDTVEKFYYLLHHYVDIDNLFLRDWSDDPIEHEWDQPQTIKAFAEKWIRIFSEGTPTLRD